MVSFLLFTLNVVECVKDVRAQKRIDSLRPELRFCNSILRPIVKVTDSLRRRNASAGAGGSPSRIDRRQRVEEEQKSRDKSFAALGNKIRRNPSAHL